ncbi:unnamed protein product, partial [Hymenolepis diminuta]
NADVDTDAHVETHQIIVVKSPEIDGAANGEDPPMFSNKIRLYSIKLSKARIGWPRIFIIMASVTFELTRSMNMQ